MKDIKNTWPFYNVSFPKSINCEDAEVSEAGEEYYDGDDGAEGCFWESVEFDGEFVNVGFSCDERFRGGSIDIDLSWLNISEPNNADDIETLMKELAFVKEVLECSD